MDLLIVHMNMDNKIFCIMFIVLVVLQCNCIILQGPRSRGAGGGQVPPNISKIIKN